MHLIPLLKLPEGSIETGGDDQRALKKLWASAKPEQGFFMVRYHFLRVPSGTFLLRGGLDLTGRWLLGRIRKHRTQPGRFEILVRRARTCYYLAVDSKAELASELRFMASDGDGDLAEALATDSPWTITTDAEFDALGFNT